jgi:hypothetical protein
MWFLVQPMPRPKLKNIFKLMGANAIVDISTKKYPNHSMTIDLDKWQWLLDQDIGRVSSNGSYAQVIWGGKPKTIHTILTPHFKETVDHINHNSFDNRMVNFRDVSQHEQARNQTLSKVNKSGVSGVIERKGVKGSTWRALISDGVKQVYLGSFKTLAKATAVRKAAEIKYGYHPLHGAK